MWVTLRVRESITDTDALPLLVTKTVWVSESTVAALGCGPTAGETITASYLSDHQALDRGHDQIRPGRNRFALNKDAGCAADATRERTLGHKAGPG